MTNDRPSWEEYFKQLAELTSTRSCCNKLHVGCILVSNNRIVAQGYNGFLPGCPHISIIRNNHEQATVHAGCRITLLFRGKSEYKRRTKKTNWRYR